MWEKVLRRTTARTAAVLFDPALFWEVFGTYEGEPIVFDSWQRAFLRDHSRLRASEKAPQIGFSWLCALEAVWDGLIHLDSTSGFVSVDQREAGEKILYARKAYLELPEQFHAWVPLAKESSEELWFGEGGRPSRLMSIPATSALRGRRMSVYLDEVDFYKDAGHDAKRIAMGRITRGGRVTMGSTCFGIETELDKTMRTSGNFSKCRLPYTVAQKPEVQEAIELARQELDDVDFDEEYGCVRGGGSGDTFSVELLRRVQHKLGAIDQENLPSSQPLLLAYDVAGGTGRHPALLTALVHDADRVWRQRCIVEIRDRSLPDQEAALIELMDRLTSAVLVVDSTAIGLHIAQSLKARYGKRVILMQPGSKPADMDPQDRVQMALELKRLLEAGDLELLPDKEQTLQLRRTRIVNGKIEQSGSKKKTHYDRMWTVTYAAYGIRNSSSRSIYERRGLLVVGGSSATGFSGRRLHRVGG